MAYKEPRKGEVAPIIVEVDRYGGKRIEIDHPAFGQISASRVQIGGDGVYLYGSDFGHNAAIKVEVKRSQLERSLNSDNYYNKAEIVHLYLSENQWATLVSSLNSGSGVPCTLTWNETDKGIPGIPATDRVPQFKKEMKETTQEALSRLAKLEEMIAGLSLSKKANKELSDQIRMTKMSIDSSIHFVQEQFDEHMETTVEKAMQEFHGWMTNERLRNNNLSLTNDKPETLRIEK